MNFKKIKKNSSSIKKGFLADRYLLYYIRFSKVSNF